MLRTHDHRAESLLLVLSSRSDTLASFAVLVDNARGVEQLHRSVVGVEDVDRDGLSRYAVSFHKHLALFLAVTGYANELAIRCVAFLLPY